MHAFISSLVAAVKSEAEVLCLYVPATSRAAINKAFPDWHSGMKANKKTCSVYEKHELGDILFPDLWTEIAKCGWRLTVISGSAHFIALLQLISLACSGVGVINKCVFVAVVVIDFLMLDTFPFNDLQLLRQLHLHLNMFKLFVSRT